MVSVPSEKQGVGHDAVPIGSVVNKAFWLKCHGWPPRLAFLCSTLRFLQSSSLASTDSSDAPPSIISWSTSQSHR